MNIRSFRLTGMLLVFAALIFSAGQTSAASAEEINIKVDATLEKFNKEVNGGAAFLAKADGVLVFPEVLKAGIGIGGEYGEGALRVGGKTVQYYSTASASIGFQLGAQSRAIILVFLDKEALKKFRDSDGWEAGVDGSVALIQVGAAGDVSTAAAGKPIVGFMLTNAGLMYNLTLEGTKFTKIVR